VRSSRLVLIAPPTTRWPSRHSSTNSLDFSMIPRLVTNGQAPRPWVPPSDCEHRRRRSWLLRRGSARPADRHLVWAFRRKTARLGSANKAAFIFCVMVISSKFCRFSHVGDGCLAVSFHLTGRRSSSMHFRVRRVRLQSGDRHLKCNVGCPSAAAGSAWIMDNER